MSYRILVGALVLSAAVFPNSAFGDAKAIPTQAIALKNNENAAIDLLLNGKPLDPDKAADLRKNGTDLSLLEPSANDVWSNTKLSATDFSTSNFPVDGTVLEFKQMIRLNPEGWLRAQVQAVGSDGVTRDYRLLASLNLHQALMRAALLRKLGYPVQSPKWYKRVVIRFADEKQRRTFGDSLSDKSTAARKRWIVSEDEKKNEVVLQDIMLEPSTIVVPTSWYMGQIEATHFKGRRTMRGLLVPFVLLDVPESVNMFSWEPTQVINENVIFTHKYADAFTETTYDDVRWMAERIGRLTRADFKEIVDAGMYPPDIAAVIYEKTLARRNNIVVQVDVAKRLSEPKFPFDLKVTIGSVEQGKVTQETYDGYALRFTHGDPESPLQTDDIVQFIKIETISALIRELAANVNQALEFLPIDRLQKDRNEKLYQSFVDYINSKPTKPYVQPISTWGGPIGGFSVNASRSLVTGSYFGDQDSDFKVSLVDQISGGVRIGYILGIDGFPKVIPGFGANLSVIRSYVHVRPIPSLEAASKKGWDELWVPGFMKGLAESLKTSDEEDPDANFNEMTQNISKFLDDLKEHESFTITDTISAGANASLIVPLTTLLGIDPVSYAATISLGASANQLVLRRTTFTRENGLIKVYLQNIESKTLGVSLDLYVWMNIMRVGYENKWGQARTRAFHLEEKPTEGSKLRKTILALRGILRANNSEILEEEFHPYKLHHETDTDSWNGKFLFWRWTNIEEWHRVKVEPPKDPAKGILDTEKYRRTLFSHRILKRTGRNYYAFLGDILDGLIVNSNSQFLKPGILTGGGGTNPKDSFFGSARWVVTNTEAEITKGREGNPVTTTEHYWAGWDLSKADLFKTFDKLDAKLKGLNLALPLIDRNVFNDMLRLQLYEIRSTFIIYETGMKDLRAKILTKKPEKANMFLALTGWDDYSPTDKEVVDKVLIPLYGQARFDDFCLAQKLSGGEAGYGEEKPFSYRGVKYPCLMPWMWDVLSLRRKYPDDREEQVKWATRLLTLLDRNADLSQVIKFLGKENIFYQLKVSGFRTRDENGDKADYLSSTVGTWNTKDRAGVFSDFTTDYQIMSSEMNASYLSEGY